MKPPIKNMESVVEATPFFPCFLVLTLAPEHNVQSYQQHLSMKAPWIPLTMLIW